MTKREIEAARSKPRSPPFHRQIIELASAVERIGQRREEWCHWRDANCGRALDLTDGDCASLLAAAARSEMEAERGFPK